MNSMASMWLRQSIATQTDRTATLRKMNSLTSSAKELTLVVASDVSIGGLSVDVRAGAGKLIGSVVVGTRFKFGGTGTEYAVYSAAKTDNSGLIHIVFVPATIVSIAAGTSVVFTSNHIDYSGCPVIEFPVDLTQKLLVDNAAQQKVIPVSDHYPAPEMGDLLDGKPVLKAVIVETNGAGYYHLYLGN